MPVYRRPSNLFVRGATQSSAGLPNGGKVFRKIGRRKLVPYYDRAEIEDGAIEGRGLEICFLKDQTDLLFSQIQGSARVSLDDGSTVRINYDAHNGYPYTPVGRILIERNIIPRDQMSMQKIREWMDGEPRRRQRVAAAEQILCVLPRGEALRQGRSGRRPGRAADAGPLDRGRQGAACLRHAVLHRGRVADRNRNIQDAVSPADDRAGHGSAIVGPARADLYFGAGVDAGKVAGRFRHTMRFVMLVPKSLDPSARGRKMPVPDARPSEKIAKLFPQVDPLKDAAERPEDAAAASAAPRPRPASAAQAAVVKPVPLPAARPDVKPASETLRHRHIRRFRHRP